MSGLPPSYSCLASMAGSELPWWSPIAVSVLLLALAFVVHERHRPPKPSAPPPDGPLPPFVA